MSAAIMETQLLANLRGDAVLAARGCVAERLPAGGIAIARGAHHRGIWAWQSSRFMFTPGGYREPTAAVDSVAEAVIHTRTVICAS